MHPADTVNLLRALRLPENLTEEHLPSGVRQLYARISEGMHGAMIGGAFCDHSPVFLVFLIALSELAGASSQPASSPTGESIDDILKDYEANGDPHEVVARLQALKEKKVEDTYFPEPAVADPIPQVPEFDTYDGEGEDFSALANHVRAAHGRSLPEEKISKDTGPKTLEGWKQITDEPIVQVIHNGSFKKGRFVGVAERGDKLRVRFNGHKNAKHFDRHMVTLG